MKGNRPTVTPRRRARQRGSYWLEAAIVFNVFFAVIFALIDFSMAVFIKNCVQSAVRDGVRYGITDPVMTGLNAAIEAQVVSEAMGFVKTSQVSVTYTNPVSMTQVTDNTGPTPGNILTVSVTGLSWAWMCPYARSSTPMQISVSSADLMEPTADGTVPTP